MFELRRKLLGHAFFAVDDEGGAGSGGSGDGEDGEDPGDALDRAEKESATHSRAEYGDAPQDADGDGTIGIREAFGLDSSRDVAGMMAGAGFSDTDTSEALFNDGIGYRERAGLLGPLDAAVTGPISRAAVGAATGLAFAANPALGLASSVADSYLARHLAHMAHWQAWHWAGWAASTWVQKSAVARA